MPKAVTRAHRPAAIKVGPFVYRVKDWDQRAANNSEAWGMCDKATHTILLDQSMGPQKMREVLLHEINHAIYNAVGLNIHDEISEERIVLAMTYQQLAVMRDNPDLVAWLMEEDVQ